MIKTGIYVESFLLQYTEKHIWIPTLIISVFVTEQTFKNSSIWQPKEVGQLSLLQAIDWHANYPASWIYALYNNTEE